MRKLFPYLLLLLGAAALLFSLPFLIQVDRYRAPLANYLSLRLNHKVLIGKLEASFFPPALKLKDVSILNGDESAPLVHIQAISAGIEALPLLKAKIIPQTLVMDQWLASIRRKADGTWAWEEWMPSTAKWMDNENWPITDIAATDGECHWIDPYAGRGQELVFKVSEVHLNRRDLHLSAAGTLENMPVPVNVSFDGTGRFLASPEWSGTFQMAAGNQLWVIQAEGKANHLDLKGQSKEWRGDLVLPLLRFYSRWEQEQGAASGPAFKFSNWNVHYVSEGVGGLRTFTQSMDVAGGHAEIKGTLKPSIPGFLASVDLGFQGVHSQDLEPLLFNTTFWEGSLTGLGHLEVSLSSETWTSVNGQGALEIKGGRFHWPESLSRSLRKAHMMHYMAKKFPTLQENTLPLQSLSLHWSARRGLVTIEDSLAVLGDVKAAFVGTLDPSHRGIEGYLGLLVREKSPDLLKEIPASYVDRSLMPPKVQPMYGVFQGDWSRLSLRAHKNTKLPRAILNKLRKALH